MIILLFIILLIGLILFFLPGYTPKINNSGVQSKESIAELIKINIGNSEQWIMVRSENKDNPIILFVHGGPGTSQLTLMRHNTRIIEKYFTIVNWDQRGAGKSYYAVKNRKDMNIDQFVSDIIELTRYLGSRFNKKKIILAGHSWGSVIGILAAQKRPDLFCAYIGIGQMSNVLESERISYEWTLRQALASNDTKSVNKLKDMGTPPYSGTWQKKFMTQRQILGKYGGEYFGSKTGAFGIVIKNLIFSTEYTLLDRINFFRGIFGSVKLIFPDLLKVNLFQTTPELKIPVWFMLGRHDFEVPSILSEKYFNFLKAPDKYLFWFENSSHLPNTEERDLFNRVLVEKVLPVAECIEKDSLHNDSFTLKNN